jgi:hypothetical protein
MRDMRDTRDMRGNLSPGQFAMTPDADKGQLFDPGSVTHEDPYEFAHRPDIMWHSSDRVDLEPLAGEPFHAGTLAAAHQRRKWGWYHPVEISGERSLPQGGYESAYDPDTDRRLNLWDDNVVNMQGGPESARKRAQSELDSGKVLAYSNIKEDEGSTSIVTTNPQNVKFWSSERPEMRGMRLVGARREPKFDADVIDTVIQDPLPGIGGETRLFHRRDTSLPMGEEQEFDIPLGYHRDSVHRPAPASETLRENMDRYTAWSKRKPVLNAHDIVLGLKKVDNY